MPLKTNQAKAIRNKLLTDSSSTNEEIIRYFVSEVNITEKAAKEYIACRNTYLNHPAFKKDRDQLLNNRIEIMPVKNTVSKPFWIDGNNYPLLFSGFKNIMGFSGLNNGKNTTIGDMIGKENFHN